MATLLVMTARRVLRTNVPTTSASTLPVALLPDHASKGEAVIPQEFAIIRIFQAAVLTTVNALLRRLATTALAVALRLPHALQAIIVEPFLMVVVEQ